MNSIIVFSADGKLRLALLNVPGTFHNSTITDCGACEEMEQIFERIGSKDVVDSDFKIRNKEFLVKSSQLGYP